MFWSPSLSLSVLFDPFFSFRLLLFFAKALFFIVHHIYFRATKLPRGTNRCRCFSASAISLITQSYCPRSIYCRRSRVHIPPFSCRSAFHKFDRYPVNRRKRHRKSISLVQIGCSSESGNGKQESARSNVPHVARYPIVGNQRLLPSQRFYVEKDRGVEIRCRTPFAFSVCVVSCNLFFSSTPSRPIRLIPEIGSER